VHLRGIGRHRRQEFLYFLKLIDIAVPSGLDLHLICCAGPRAAT
jgi:hypothetical protein